MRLFEALLATWAPAETRPLAGWTLRRGDGGGNRVSAATLDAPDGDIAVAEAAMRAWGQRPTFMLRPGDEALDRRLEGLGYASVAASLIVAAAPETVAPEARDDRAILCDAPLASMREIWSEGGIGPARLAVMARAVDPKTYLLGRSGDAPAACAFAACDREIAMLQAPPGPRHRAHPRRRRLGRPPRRHHLCAGGRGRQRAGARRLRAARDAAGRRLPLPPGPRLAGGACGRRPVPSPAGPRAILSELV